MSRYAQINEDFFDDDDFAGWSTRDILLYLFYCITSKNLIGIWRRKDRSDIERINAMELGQTGRRRYTPVQFKASQDVLHKSFKVYFEGNWAWVVGKGNWVNGKKQTRASCILLEEPKLPAKLKKMFLTKYPDIADFCGYPIDGVSLPIPKPIPRPIPRSRRIKRKTKGADSAKKPTVTIKTTENTVEQNKERVAQFLTQFQDKPRGGRMDTLNKKLYREEMDKVQRCCRHFVTKRVKVWKEKITDQKKEANAIFGEMLNLIRFGIRKKPKGVMNLHGEYTPPEQMIKIIDALSDAPPKKDPMVLLQWGVKNKSSIIDRRRV